MKVRGWSWATSWPVVALWAAVTLSVALASLVALFTPAWYVRDPPVLTSAPIEITENSQVTCFGVWTWCYGGEESRQCGAVGESVGNISGATPSAVWVMVGALHGGGGALLAVTGIAAALTPLLPTTHARAAFAHVAGNIQAAAGKIFYTSFHNLSGFLISI